MMGAVMPATCDHPCGDGGWGANYGILNLPVNDMHNNDANDMGNPSNVESQELADLLRGILDGQQACSNPYTQPCRAVPDHRAQSTPHALPTPFSPHQLQFSDDDLSCCIAQHYLHDAASNCGTFPLADRLTASNLDCSLNHSTSSFSAQLSDDQEAFNEDNILPNSINSSSCEAALMMSTAQQIDPEPRLISINDNNRTTIHCKPLAQFNMHRSLDEISISGIEYGEAGATYELLSPSKELVHNIDHSKDVNVTSIQGRISRSSDDRTVCADAGYGTTAYDRVGDHHVSKHDVGTCSHEGLYEMVRDDAAHPNGMHFIIQREAAYAAAALQPVDWTSILSMTVGARPKRRNVRISHDPQTVSARRRRERISDRIRILQRLVPGATRMDTASMLDEAIQYLKYLKSQVQALEWLERGTSSACVRPLLASCTSLPNSSEVLIN